MDARDASEETDGIPVLIRIEMPVGIEELAARALQLVEYKFEPSLRAFLLYRAIASTMLAIVQERSIPELKNRLMRISEAFVAKQEKLIANYVGLINKIILYATSQEISDEKIAALIDSVINHVNFHFIFDAGIADILDTVFPALMTDYAMSMSDEDGILREMTSLRQPALERFRDHIPTFCRDHAADEEMEETLRNLIAQINDAMLASLTPPKQLKEMIAAPEAAEIPLQTVVRAREFIISHLKEKERMKIDEFNTLYEKGLKGASTYLRSLDALCDAHGLTQRNEPPHMHIVEYFRSRMIALTFKIKKITEMTSEEYATFMDPLEPTIKKIIRMKPEERMTPETYLTLMYAFPKEAERATTLEAKLASVCFSAPLASEITKRLVAQQPVAAPPRQGTGALHQAESAAPAALTPDAGTTLGDDTPEQEKLRIG
ncbi:MAG TPA: hypothetical protein VNC84_00935 [Gammaproteobacteria bacterium]|jgi:hypothetical protein|nr:hypothetical protein [Gammaproteobacteria bacterium]